MSANLAFRIDSDIKALLDEYVKQNNTNKTAIVSEALSKYLQEQNGIEPVSVEHAAVNSDDEAKNTQNHTENIQDHTEDIQETKNAEHTIDDAIQDIDTDPDLSGLTDPDNRGDKAKQLGKLAMLGGIVWLICRRYNKE